MGERLESITQQVLSRQRLLGLVNKYHLYNSVLTPTPDDQYKKMRGDIKIDLVQTPTADESGKRELTAFKLQYTADNAAVAQQVNSAMVSYFIDENVKASQAMSESTTQFLDTQLKRRGRIAGHSRKTACGSSRKSTPANCRSRRRRIFR